MTDTKGTAAKICVREVCGANALTGVDGKKVNKLILNRWGMSTAVEVDMAGTVISAAFLDEAIGQLIAQFKKAEIVAKLKLTGLSPQDKAILNGVVVNRYHSAAKAAKPKSAPGIPPAIP